MRKSWVVAAFAAAVSAAISGSAVADRGDDHDGDRVPDLDQIQTVVVIYAENRSFDSLFGLYPGANGLSDAGKRSTTQLDRDGTVLKGLPPVWGGTDGNDNSTGRKSAITAGAPTAPEPLTEAQTEAYLGTFNHPFSLASLYGQLSNQNTNPLEYTNRDLYHRFYENQMQINGGANNKFAAWADSGGLTMMYIPNNTADHPLWALAKKNVLADNFFQGAFGGSYLNHQFLICSCAPIYPGDGKQPINPVAGGTAPIPSAVNADGITLTTTATSPASALDGPPSFVGSTVITPAIKGVFYSVNTTQPPFAPSGNAVVSTSVTPNIAPQSQINLKSSSTLPAQTQTHIGDLLTKAGVNYAYYAGGWNFALTHDPFAAGTSAANPNFQYHHQPFNFFADFDPSTAVGTANRAGHLFDAGVASPDQIAQGELPVSRFLTDIEQGTLPPVSFYKPNGPVNEHNGYANVTDGDKHIAAVVKALQSSPQYKHMLIVITYDEFGGIWDHVAPPKADIFGPGTRIPAIIISPYAKHGYIDHTQYDTTSVLRFITRKWHLPALDGIKQRDRLLVKNGHPPMGDLTNALELPLRHRDPRGGWGWPWYDADWTEHFFR